MRFNIIVQYFQIYINIQLIAFFRVCLLILIFFCPANFEESFSMKNVYSISFLIFLEKSGTK